MGYKAEIMRSRKNDRRAARLMGWLAFAPSDRSVRENPKVPRWKASSQIQTLLFEREQFTKRKAQSWARKHGFRYDSVDLTDRYVRLRQENPEQFKPSTFRTIELRESVQAVIAVPKRARTNGPPRLVFRAMLVDDHGMPLTGIGPNRLGIRLMDIRVKDGRVVRTTPEKRGMSVAPDSPFLLPRHLLPRQFPSGTSDLTVFEIPVHVLPESLEFSQDKQYHGVIHPKEEITVEEFLKHLASTVDRWTRRGG